MDYQIIFLIITGIIRLSSKRDECFIRERCLASTDRRTDGCDDPFPADCEYLDHLYGRHDWYEEHKECGVCPPSRISIQDLVRNETISWSDRLWIIEFGTGWGRRECEIRVDRVCPGSVWFDHLGIQDRCVEGNGGNESRCWMCEASITGLFEMIPNRYDLNRQALITPPSLYGRKIKYSVLEVSLSYDVD